MEIVVGIGIVVLSMGLLGITLALDRIYKTIGEISDHLDKLIGNREKDQD